MKELILKALLFIASYVRALMPFAIGMAKRYLEVEYRSALTGGELSLKAKKLQYLALLRKKLHPPTEFYPITISLESGISLKANLCQQYCGDIYYGLGFEKNELALVKRLIALNDTVLDVGANIGIYTVLVADLVGCGGKVYSFEPLPDVFSMLGENVATNQCVNVSINQVAVSDNNGEAQIFVNTQNALSSLGNTNRGKVLRSQKVSVVSLDAYAEASAIEHADFLKIDVEGYEGHVLRGALKLIRNSPDLVIMSELARKNFEPLGFSVNEVITFMVDLGFEAWMMENHAEIQLYPVIMQSGEYPFQNFLFIRPDSAKYSLLKDYMTLGQVH